MMKSPIFVGGSARSGTTLVRVILDSHPNIACGPEIKIIPIIAEQWSTIRNSFAKPMMEYNLTPKDVDEIYNNMIRSFMEKYRIKQGKARMAEKSPNNVFYFQHLHYLFPESPLIHVIRDGRDIICSLLQMKWVDPTTGQPIAYTREADKAADYWVQAVMAGRRALNLPGLKDRYLEIRYEDIINKTEATLKRLFEFIDEPWDPVVLKFHEQKRNLAGESSADQVSKPLYKKAVARWQTDLKEEDKPVIKKIAGPLLIELGYTPDDNW
nr:sulfotransferase [candidate division Zixibacteria bacterium]